MLPVWMKGAEVLVVIRGRCRRRGRRIRVLLRRRRFADGRVGQRPDFRLGRRDRNARFGVVEAR